MSKNALLIDILPDTEVWANAARSLGHKVIGITFKPMDKPKWIDELILLENRVQYAPFEDVILEYEIDYIIPHAVPAHTLQMTGRLNQEFDLPGIKHKAAVCGTDKYLVARLMEANGLEKYVPKTHYLNLNDAMNTMIPWDWPYPTIAKPRLGAASFGVRRIMDNIDMIRFLATEIEGYARRYSHNDYLIQEDLGHLTYIGLNGVIQNGQVVVFNTWAEGHQARDSHCYGQSYYTSHSEESPITDRAKTIINELAILLDMNQSAFMAEFMYDGYNLFLIDFNPRPAGMNSSRGFSHILGFDYALEHIKMTIQGNGNFNKKPTKYSGMALTNIRLPQGRIKDITWPTELIHDERVIHFETQLAPGVTIPEFKDQADSYIQGQIITVERTGMVAFFLGQSLVRQIKVTYDRDTGTGT